MKKIISLFALSAFICSCTKEFTVVTDFDYTVFAEHDSIAGFDKSHPTKFIITPDREATTQNFSFKYLINEGSGAFIFKDSLPPNKWIKLDTLVLDMNYITDSFSIHEIEAYVKDNYGREEILNIGYAIQKEEFEVITKINPAVTTIGEEAIITINFAVPETSKGVEYFIKYKLQQGNATITDLDGNILNENELYPINIGITEWKIKSNETGVPNITFTSENSTGFKYNTSDSYKVEKYTEPFTFLVAQDNGVKLSDKPFNISVTANATNGHDTDTNYFITYQFNGTDRGSVTLGGTTYLEGEKIPIPHGFSNLTFIPNGDENFSIIWKGSNSTDEEKLQNMEIDMYQRPKISGVLTGFFGDNKRSCGNGCNWNYHYLVKINVIVDPSAEADVFRIRLLNDRVNHPTYGQYQSYTGSFSEGIKWDEFHEFYSPTFVPTGASELYDGQPYILTVVDSNDVENTIEGTFTNDLNDGQ